MKKYLIALLPVIVSIFFVACKKDGNTANEKPSLLKYTNSNLSYDFEDIGQIHNLGLEYIRQQGGLPSTLSMEFATYANGLTHTFFKNNYMPNLSVQDSLNMDATIRYSVTEGLFGDGNAMWQNAMENISGNISLREKKYIDSCLFIISEASQISDIDEQYNYISDELNKLIGSYESVDWGTDEGSLAGGVLYIAKSSGDYWYNISVTEGTVQGIWPILQADAGGYLFGWTRAWLDGEPTSNGRINAGLRCATECSTLGFL